MYAIALANASFTGSEAVAPVSLSEEESDGLNSLKDAEILSGLEGVLVLGLVERKDMEVFEEETALIEMRGSRNEA